MGVWETTVGRGIAADVDLVFFFFFVSAGPALFCDFLAIRIFIDYRALVSFFMKTKKKAKD